MSRHLCTFVFAISGLAVTPCYAVPVLFTLEADPFTEWEFAQRDAAGRITTVDVADTDGDGTASFVAQIDRGDVESTSVHVTSGRGKCWYLFFDGSPISNGSSPAGIPFLTSTAGDPLIVELNNDFRDMFSIGQRVNVRNGVIEGFDGLVHENPDGIPSAAELLATDVGRLPTFTGDAEVGGLLSASLGQPGDTDGDFDVDIDDLNAVRNNFGTLPQEPVPGDTFPFDGLVNIDDLNRVRNNFGAHTTAVPEPSTLALASLFAFVAVITRRRRS